MKKITKQAIEAFYGVSLTNEDTKQRHIVRSKGNTQVRQTIHHSGQSYIAELWLHGNKIAKRSVEGLAINPQGYCTVTTKERLNGLPGVHITQRNFIWRLNGEELDVNEWTLVRTNPN